MVAIVWQPFLFSTENCTLLGLLSGEAGDYGYYVEPGYKPQFTQITQYPQYP
jgi:hypothetical protein